MEVILRNQNQGTLLQASLFEVERESSVKVVVIGMELEGGLFAIETIEPSYTGKLIILGALKLLSIEPIEINYNQEGH